MNNHTNIASSEQEDIRKLIERDWLESHIEWCRKNPEEARRIWFENGHGESQIEKSRREVEEDGRKPQPIFTMVWATATAIRAKVADVPERWLYSFAVNHPDSVRKFAQARNGKLLFRVQDVLDAIERRENIF